MTGLESIILWWMAAQKYCLQKYREIPLWQWSKVQTVPSRFGRTQGDEKCLEETIVSQLACPSPTPGWGWSHWLRRRHCPVAEKPASDVWLGVLAAGSLVPFGILNWEQGFLFRYLFPHLGPWYEPGTLSQHRTLFFPIKKYSQILLKVWMLTA